MGNIGKKTLKEGGLVLYSLKRKRGYHTYTVSVFAYLLHSSHEFPTPIVEKVSFFSSVSLLNLTLTVRHIQQG